jgi:hypothetical protein
MNETHDAFIPTDALKLVVEQRGAKERLFYQALQTVPLHQIEKGIGVGLGIAKGNYDIAAIHKSAVQRLLDEGSLTLANEPESPDMTVYSPKAFLAQYGLTAPTKSETA